MKKDTPKDPIIRFADKAKAPFSAVGESIVIHEWTGSGPEYLHVHYKDDEAWHVLEGELTFKFIDKEVVASKSSTVFVPAGVAHTYSASHESCRYLMILTPRLDQLIAECTIRPLKSILKLCENIIPRFCEGNQ